MATLKFIRTPAINHRHYHPLPLLKLEPNSSSECHSQRNRCVMRLQLLRRIRNLSLPAPMRRRCIPSSVAQYVERRWLMETFHAITRENSQYLPHQKTPWTIRV